jgi:hypothetical protein
MMGGMKNTEVANDLGEASTDEAAAGHARTRREFLCAWGRWGFLGSLAALAGRLARHAGHGDSKGLCVNEGACRMCQRLEGCELPDGLAARAAVRWLGGRAGSGGGG